MDSDENLNQYTEFLSLPSEFSNKSNEEILTYLRELQQSKQQQQQTTEMYRMKIMFVGPGEAGKSTLVHKLLTGEFKFGEFSMTDGVSMRSWEASEIISNQNPGNNSENINNNSKIMLSLWDFGGQEVYMNTHPMLFSTKTIYLLVWNPRVKTTIGMLEEYLLNIQSKSSSSPIMLVTTHSSEVNSNSNSIISTLSDLKKYKYVRHVAVDSSTGEGVEELKRSIVELVVSEEYCGRFSRCLIPEWYLRLENELKSFPQERFSITREEFESLCLSLWNSSSSTSSSLLSETNLNINTEMKERIELVLSLFDDWGIIFILPSSKNKNNKNKNDKFEGNFETKENNEDKVKNKVKDCVGDIVLDPQRLADVFKCVISCHKNTTEGKQLFEDGILVHNQVGYLWTEYEPRLHVQFLDLLHDCELAIEIFDEEGNSTRRSLIPSILPEFNLNTLNHDNNDNNGNNIEKTIRDKYLSKFNSMSSSSPRRISNMIKTGFVRITFDCLLSNFFPMLMVRLRYLSCDCFRRGFVVKLSESSSSTSRRTSRSVVYVMEERESNSIVLYPGGSSFDATAVCNEAIRSLLDERFPGMKIIDVMFSAEDETFRKNKLIGKLKKDINSKVIIDISNDKDDEDNDEDEDEDGSEDEENGSKIEINLRFLCVLLMGLDEKIKSQLHSKENELDSFLSSSSCRVSEKDKRVVLDLKDRMIQFKRTGDISDKVCLSRYMMKSIPIFLEHGLNVRSYGGVVVGKVLWVIVRIEINLYLIAVSPSMIANLPWELVFESKLSISCSLITNTNSTSNLNSNLNLGEDGIENNPLSKLLVKSLKCLLNFSSNHVENSFEIIGLLSQSEFQLNSNSNEGIVIEKMKEKEDELFVVDRDIFGENVYVSERMLQQQRKQDPNVGVTIEDIQGMLEDSTMIITKTIENNK